MLQRSADCHGRDQRGSRPSQDDSDQERHLGEGQQSCLRGQSRSDRQRSHPPDYLFEGPGEVLALNGDFAQLRWRRPVPDVWLRLDQLEAC